MQCAAPHDTPSNDSKEHSTTNRMLQKLQRIQVATRPQPSRFTCVTRTIQGRRQLSNIRPHCLADGDDEAPVLTGDWRDFRAKLVLKEGSDASASVRRIADNQRLLEIQNPSLAREGMWAHATSTIEKGGLLIAKPETAELLNNERMWQVVILIVAHNEQGSMGLILNRPTSLVFGTKTKDKKSGLPFPVENSVAELQERFEDNTVYMGGHMAQQVVHMLHGYELPRAVEIVPGVFVGGEAAALQLVAPRGSGAGGPEPDEFKFFSGAVVWEPGQLKQEMEQGAWINAACSRALVLKSCKQLPVPLWREVLTLMGGEYLAVADSDASDDDE